MSGVLTGSADEGYFLECYFHHPLEVVLEVAVDNEYIESALVVGNKDVRCVFVDVFTTFDFGFDE